MENIFGKIIFAITSFFVSVFGTVSTQPLTTNIELEQNNKQIENRYTETEKSVNKSTVLSNLLYKTVETKQENSEPIPTNLLMDSTEVKLDVNGIRIYSNSDLQMLAGPNPTKIPLGDNKYTTTSAKKGYIYLCNARKDGFGAQAAGPWIRNGYWYPSEKINISGDVNWPNATFKNLISGITRTLSGNGLPTTHNTGTFPIARDEEAYSYDRNPNSIKSQNLKEQVPVNPVYSDTPYCMGGEVGTMLTGVPLFNAFDATLRDAAAYEVQDKCEGHPEVTGQYHYHSESGCFDEQSVETVLGFALDGFPITGGEVSEGKYLTTDDLDVCHGLVSEIVLDGKQVTTYHYVMTADFPYSVSCFRGKPSRVNPSNPPTSGGVSNGISGGTGSGMSGGQTPPKAAQDACISKQTGNSCEVSTSNGKLSGECRTTPDNKYFACIPNR